MIMVQKSKTFFLKLTIPALALLSACSASKTEYGVSWNEASVNESSLKEKNCNFSTKRGSDGKEFLSLECAATTDPNVLDEQIKALANFVTESKEALDTAKLNPTTMVKIVHKKALAESTLASLKTKRASLAVNNLLNNAELTTAMALYSVNKTILKAEGVYSCTFDVNNKISCPINTIKALVPTDENAPSFKKFQEALIAFASNGRKVLSLDASLDEAAKNRLTQEVESVEALVKDLLAQQQAE